MATHFASCARCSPKWATALPSPAAPTRSPNGCARIDSAAPAPRPCNTRATSSACNAQARYTALAGFVEPGESIEDAVHREVEEEVGLKVRDLRYFGSQSWPFPHSLMIAFTAEYAGGDIRVQEDEIADAQWFGPGQPFPDIPMRESIAGRLVRANLPPGIRVE